MAKADEKRLAATMTEWVDVRLDRRSDIVAWDAGQVAEQMGTADLFIEHAVAARELHNARWESDEHDAWKAALGAVCNELGQRIDAARFEKAS